MNGNCDTALANAHFLRGWLFGQNAPKEIMDAIEELVSAVSDSPETTVSVRPAIDLTSETSPARNAEAVDEPTDDPPTEPRQRAGRWSQADRDKLIAMKKAGHSWTEIARTFGKLPSAVSGYYYLLMRQQALPPGEGRPLPASSTGSKG